MKQVLRLSLSCVPDWLEKSTADLQVSIESSIEREITERVKLNVWTSGLLCLLYIAMWLFVTDVRAIWQAQRQAREERLVQVGSADANVPGTANIDRHLEMDGVTERTR